MPLRIDTREVPWGVLNRRLAQNRNKRIIIQIPALRIGNCRSVKDPTYERISSTHDGPGGDPVSEKSVYGTRWRRTAFLCRLFWHFWPRQRRRDRTSLAPVCGLSLL